MGALYGDVQTHAPSAVRGEDEEAVHGMRVALRRLRTLFDAFEPSFRRRPFAKMRKQLQKVSRKLGILRDMDVHLASLRAHRTGSTIREAAGIDWMIAHVRAERAAGLVALQATYTSFKQSFDAGFGGALGGDAASLETHLQILIENELMKHVRQGERAFAGGDPRRMHRFRISGKRLRYILEVFGATLGERTNEPYKLLSDMQDDLGQINDANTFIALYTGLLEAMPSGDSRSCGLHALISARTKARRRALETARARWELNGARPYSAALFEALFVNLPCTKTRKAKARSNRSALASAPSSSS